MAIYHNGIKISDLFHNGKHISKIFHNGKCIYTSIAVGESLYDGIPSKGIMLYGDVTGYSSSNPLGIQGDSINLNAPLSSCPNGIKIHFSTISYDGNGSIVSGACHIGDINISKGSSSGSSAVSSYYCDDSGNGNNNITAIINGLTLSFSVTNGSCSQSHSGTVTFIDMEGMVQELLAITSITAY